jgi:hypothetical protein
MRSFECFGLKFHKIYVVDLLSHVVDLGNDSTSRCVGLFLRDHACGKIWIFVFNNSKGKYFMMNELHFHSSYCRVSWYTLLLYLQRVERGTSTYSRPKIIQDSAVKDKVTFVELLSNFIGLLEEVCRVSLVQERFLIKSWALCCKFGMCFLPFLIRLALHLIVCVAGAKFIEARHQACILASVD